MYDVIKVRYKLVIAPNLQFAIIYIVKHVLDRQFTIWGRKYLVKFYSVSIAAVVGDQKLMLTWLFRMFPGLLSRFQGSKVVPLQDQMSYPYR